MGYASLIEDIIKRFDAEFSFAPILRTPTSPSPAAVAEALRREAEKHATALAIRQFQKNQRTLETQKTKILQLTNQLARAQRELRDMRSKFSGTLQAKQALERELTKPRQKYAGRAQSPFSQAPAPPGPAVSPIVTQIENMKASELAALDNQSRERFKRLRDYASSERKVQAQATELEVLRVKLANINHEIQTFSEFMRNIERERCSLAEESRTYRNWDKITDWLDTHTITPKELPPPTTPKPFNPAFPSGPG